MPADLNDYFNKNKNNNNNNKNQFEPPQVPDFLNSPITWIIGIILVIILFAKPFVVINEGEVGILSTTGKYEKEPLKPGMHFFIPFIQKIIIVDTRVHLINYKQREEIGTMRDRFGSIKVYPAINVLDARGLPVKIELTVSYHLDPNTAPETIATYGLSWEDKIINPIVRDVVRNVIGRFPAEELPVKRNTIATLIEEGINKNLNAIKGKPVILDGVQLREISLPPKIKEQIERVQIAKQEAERAKYEVLKAKQEAMKKAAIAQGEADAKKIEAQGQADAILIQAKAQAKANVVISHSITPALLKLKQIEVQGKFNEALKTNTNAQIFLTPGGAVPNIWIDAKNKQLTSSESSKK